MNNNIVQFPTRRAPESTAEQVDFLHAFVDLLAGIAAEEVPAAPAPIVELPTAKEAEQVQDNRRRITPEALTLRAEYAARLEQPAPNAYGVRVGDLFAASFGYSMTCVDFYEVVGTKGKATVILREIAKEGGSGWDGYCKPCRGEYIGEPVEKRITARKDGSWTISAPDLANHHLTPTTDDAEHYYNHLD